ncbi:unnamed protein product [Ostreobium quekettii]|uniref:HIT-type domain-containing protein n=1 Tax=Ostreobium quekettii TaxID=121088 RepID=A0A8S1JD78_9CHLO|nr:unnamed protein product [Ostreobium quekettii]
MDLFAFDIAEQCNAPVGLPLCSVCQKCPAKYRCPGCSTRTCCLACVRGHKEAAQCSGKRSRTDFISIKDFTDSNLLSDFRFLEELKTASDCASRHRPSHRGMREWPKRMKILMSEAQKRHVALQFLPQGMKRQRLNSTWYNIKRQRIHWDIEWRFACAKVEIMEKRVDEDTRLDELLQKHLNFAIGKGALLHKLKPYSEAGVEQLQVVMRRERCKANEVDYYLLDKAAPLREQLVGRVVIEFPIFTVLLPSEMSSYTIHKAQMGQTANGVSEQQASGQEPLHR